MTTILLTMPKLSPTMEEGVIAKWHKKEGDAVEVGDLLLEVSTDKATVEHTAIDSGFIRKIMVSEGKTAAVNDLIAIMTEEKDAAFDIPQKVPVKTLEAARPAAEVQKPEIKPAPISGENTARVFASPLAKRLAKEKGVSLKGLTGSGPRGRIMSRDLEALYTKSAQLGAREAFSPMRKSIGKHLQEAKRDIPHFYLAIVVDADPLITFRQQLVTHEKKITFNDCIVKAVSLALLKHPDVNVGCSKEGDAILRFPSIDISVAVSIPGGLITPIVTQVDQKSLFTVSEEIVSLRDLAVKGKLQESQYRGGSFTISNLGMFGIESFQAIINPPQAAILAVGAILEKPVVKKGAVEAGRVMNLTLSLDHRVIDGQQGALFLQSLKNFLEEPILLLV